MWCKFCNIETNEKTCPICGKQTSEDIPIEIFWCDTCKIPVIKQVTDTRKLKCTCCGHKMKYLAKDIRPVFPTTCTLDFKYCTFIDKSRTADYTITKRLREMVNDDANKEDIIGFLVDKNVPGDDIVYSDLADEILTHKPEQGYLTISNALQWRLQYARVIALDNTVNGVLNYEW